MSTHTTSEAPAPGFARYSLIGRDIHDNHTPIAWLRPNALDGDNLALVHTLVHRANCYESLLEVAQLIEWSGTVQGDGEAFRECPCCFSVDFWGHKKDCELAHAIATATKGAL